MHNILDAFTDEQRRLQFVLTAASVLLLCAAAAGCADMKRPSSTFDYNPTAGDEKEAGSGAAGNGGAGAMNHHE